MYRMISLLDTTTHTSADGRSSGILKTTQNKDFYLKIVQQHPSDSLLHAQKTTSQHLYQF